MINMNIVDLIREVTLFSQLDEAELERIARNARLTTFPKGSLIIEEGGQDTRLFIIANGQACVVKGLGTKAERRLQELGKFTYFGEMVLIDGLPRSASVIAIEDVEAVCIDHLDLCEEIRKCPDMAIELLKGMSGRLRTMNRAMVGAISTIAPICIKCHCVAAKPGKWVSMEEYIATNSGMNIEQTICPECSIKNYPSFYVNS
jgi:CRP/FNR family cyclic AMP-dependent transcriptional regulator